MSLRSPLSKVLGLGAAGDGPGHWWAQRVSAVGSALLGLWFAIGITGLDLADRGDIADWVSHPVNSVLLILLLACVSYHSNLGVRVVIEDYSRGWAKVAGLVVVQFLHVLVAAIGIVAVLRLSLGG